MNKTKALETPLDAINELGSMGFELIHKIYE